MIKDLFVGPNKINIGDWVTGPDGIRLYQVDHWSNVNVWLSSNGSPYLILISRRSFCHNYAYVGAADTMKKIDNPDMQGGEDKPKEIVWEDFEELSDNFNKGLPWLR